jgi:DNA-binding CsgD family transcriptional regulator
MRVLRRVKPGVNDVPSLGDGAAGHNGPLRPVDGSRRRGTVEVATAVEPLSAPAGFADLLQPRCGDQRQLLALRTLFDLLPIGVILLDPSLRIAGLNAQARSMLCERDGLSTWNGRLYGTSPIETRELRGQVACVLGGRARGVVALSLRRPSARGALQVLVVPLGDSEPPLAALLLTDPAVARGPAPDYAQRLLGLTEAEAKIAVALARGVPLPEIARRMGVQDNTVRWHLKQIYTKTGTHGQVDLVRLLLTGPSLLLVYSDESTCHTTMK